MVRTICSCNFSSIAFMLAEIRLLGFRRQTNNMRLVRGLVFCLLVVAWQNSISAAASYEDVDSVSSVASFASTHSKGGAAVGTLNWNGTARGSEKAIGGLNAYVSEPRKRPYKGAVLVISDIFGFKTDNVRLWADNLANQGFLAVVPDYFRGNPRTPADSPATFPAWLAQFPRDQVLRDSAAVMAGIRQQYKTVKRIGVQGFCWGGLYAVLLTHGQRPPASASVVYHGSLITAADVEAINQPISFQQSDPALDPLLNTTTYNQFKGILDGKRAAGLDTSITFYPNMTHGFAMRGGSSEAVTAATNAAFKAGSEFLAKYLLRK